MSTAAARLLRHVTTLGIMPMPRMSLPHSAGPDLPSALTPTQTRQPSAASHCWAEIRLRRHADYQQVYATARKHFAVSIAWFAAMRPEASSQAAPPRVGLTVGKVIGKAHERNRIKRRLRAAIQAHAQLLPAGLDLILHPRRSVLDAAPTQIQKEVAAIFSAAAAAALQHPDRLVKKPSAVAESARSTRRGKANSVPTRSSLALTPARMGTGGAGNLRAER